MFSVKDSVAISCCEVDLFLFKMCEQRYMFVFVCVSVFVFVSVYVFVSV